MINKKGGEESGGAIVVFLLIIAVALVVGLGVYTFFNRLDMTIDGQGLDTTNMILSCQKDLKLADTDGAKFAAYCGKFREPFTIGKRSSMVNCGYLVKRGVASFSEDDIPAAVASQCNSEVIEKLAYNACLTIQKTSASDTTTWKEYINGLPCTKKSVYSDFVSSGVSAPTSSDGYYVVEYSGA